MLCITLMWLTVLRRILFSLALLMLCAVSFLTGVFVARSNAPDPRPLELPATPPEQARRARELVEQALAARFAGKHGEALRLFDEASAADPSMPGLDYQRGLTQFFAGRTAEAEASARVSLEAKEQTANAYALLVLCAAARAAAGETTDPRQVEEWAQSARAKDPLSPFVHYAMGEYTRAIGQPAAAVEHYRKALERVSRADSFLVATVKAGLSGLRLGKETEPEGIADAVTAENVPPESLFFAAGKALMEGDRTKAEAFLGRAREVVQPDIFSALLKDSFFQDYLPEGIPNNPQPSGPP